MEVYKFLRCSRDTKEDEILDEITKTHEKKDGRLRPYIQMKNFRDALDECGLMDLGYVGSKFTWFKNFANGIVVWELLNRAMGTTNWFDNNLATKVMILECGSLEHKPLLIHPWGVPMRPNKLGDLNKCGWRMKDAMILWLQLGEMVKEVHR